ncbi:MAG: hypothetical protein WC490_04430 [Candidatus Margulisiibacteriota bacterium]
MDATTLIVSFLGGGITSAIITQICVWKQNEYKESKRFLEEQIKKLYGPMRWHISLSEKAIELSKNTLDAGDKVFLGKECADGEVDKTIDISNEYLKLVKYNNTKMLEILNDNYSYVDLDDIDIFNLFYEHYIRLITECNEKGGIKGPLEIYRIMGEISFIRPEVISRIKEKFLSKREELLREWSVLELINNLFNCKHKYTKSTKATEKVET